MYFQNFLEVLLLSYIKHVGSYNQYIQQTFLVLKFSFIFLLPQML